MTMLSRSGLCLLLHLTGKALLSLQTLSLIALLQAAAAAAAVMCGFVESNARNAYTHGVLVYSYTRTAAGSQ
jgi:hypothetical protein